MSTPNRQIGWSQESNLLSYISKQLDRLTGVTFNSLSALAPTYKVYTALLTQSGGDGPAGNCSDDPQPLVIGVTYQISLNDGTGDFTNVGAPNNNIGTYFVATGTTPNNWGTPGDVCLNYNTGAPVVTVLENTIGNIWFTYSDVGIYKLNNPTLTDDTKLYFSITPNVGRSFGFNWNDEDGSGAFILTKMIAGGGVVSNNDLLGKTPIEIRVYN
jgi:hypothetical protein